MPSMMLTWDDPLACDAYIAWAESIFEPPLGPGGTFYPRDRYDRYGKRVCAFLGPGGNVGYYVEPEDGPALRAGATLQLGVEWPDPEEE
ncbi:hypothetical protein [Sphingomonas hengshuiensis]|uniref:Uncharacterized protein n=1 Tax=Sphingomonas hengshuiensis TaxID=1609977 RepID=A0A7U4J8K9_9SPHN|nr:hypothetical protein [Sphingomonas hengshuiensis]AJP72257.1 hypothetical protein TS85_11345 [Sphingomonas hengshuiensis]